MELECIMTMVEGRFIINKSSNTKSGDKIWDYSEGVSFKRRFFIRRSALL